MKWFPSSEEYFYILMRIQKLHKWSEEEDLEEIFITSALKVLLILKKVIDVSENLVFDDPMTIMFLVGHSKPALNILSS